MNKKAQGLSMNTIIIAALAILVLVLLLFIVTDGFKKFWWTTETCEGVGEGRVCADSCEELEGNWQEMGAYSGTDGNCMENEVCCLRIT